MVRHRRLGWNGRLERLDGDRAEVLVGGKRVRCVAGDLAGTTAAPVVATPRAARSRGDESPAPGELMLLGLTVEEALEAVDDYLDRALRSALREARLVHGHGTGRLRDAIRQHLRHHPAVASFRSGEPKEGGNGATVVALRD
jgi:DNA mismatch repair protein MutS2